jgi:hypothetical protein
LLKAVRHTLKPIGRGAQLIGAA